jgi:hypothetical protein
MRPSEINLLHVVHVASVVILIAYTFFAFGAPPETKRRVMAITGVAALLVLLTGIRMWQGMFSFAMVGWVWVKLACWLVLSGLGGMAYKKRDKTNPLMVVALLLAVIALVMVYFKPF